MKILIINDDPSMTDLLMMMLNPIKASIEYASNGSEGLKLVKEFTPDIVLIDVMMSETDSWKVISEIRKISLVPILILSVINDPLTVAHALDEGADDFLIKPVPWEVLIAHINNLTRRKETSKPQAQILGSMQTAYE